MIKKQNLPEGHTIFCDDIRYELSGKRSLIGVYDNVLVVDQIPGSIMQVFCSMSFRNRVDSNDHCIFRVFLEVFDTGEDILLAENECLFEPFDDDHDYLPIEDAFQFQEIRWDARISPLNVPSRSRLKARVYIGDNEYRLGSLMIEEDQAAPEEDLLN